MEKLEAIIPSLEEGDWISDLDLQDAYFHIAIHLTHRKYLHFTMGQYHFQYGILPFSLSSASKAVVR